MKNRFLASLIGGGAVLALSSLTVLAASSGRASNIKSYGVYNIQSQDGKSVTLDSADLVYLADEIDELETTYKGNLLSAIQSLTDVAKEMVLDKIPVSAASSVEYNTLVNAVKNSQKPHSGDTGATVDNISANKVAFVNGKYLVGNGNDVNSAYTQGYYDGVHYTVANANIEYVYHQHVNSSGAICTATPVYTTTNPGGCYVSGGHTHNVTGTCPWHYTYHVHTGSCPYSEKEHTVHCTSRSNGYSYFACDICDWTGSHYDGGASSGWGYGPHMTEKIYSCGNSPLNSGCAYDCGFYVNTWVIGCGRTAGVTIDSATVRFV